MRRGAVATSRALAEQATASEEIARAAESLSRLVASVAKAMTEQNGAATEITRAAESMRQQSDQAAKALREQARAMKDMSVAAANTAKQIKLITQANREHGRVSGMLLQDMAEIRRITDQNVNGVRQTRTSTADLLKYAEALTSMMNGQTERNGASGRTSRTGNH